LFRGLLKYDDRKGTYGGDIANCDISNIAKISCTLNPNNGNWSDGTKIQTDDVIATLQAFRANPPNEKMKAFL
jgi:MarR-like DNA-binding transcriptional regulator SgrR of sgrS sRNA